MRIFVTLCLCFEILTLWKRLLLVCGHDLWHDELYYRRYDHYHGKYSDSELMVDVINNLGLNILMVHNKDNDNNVAFSPYGAAVILIALGEGLQGEALYEIRKALQLPYDGHTIRVGLRDIHRHLKSYFIPREGFLAGITLNSENVSIKPKYTDLLRFYGYDISSFNTALYPDTHMTTEMTTVAGREETTLSTDNKIEPTTSLVNTGQETTLSTQESKETTTPIQTTTSELQTTVSSTSRVETTPFLSEVTTSLPEEDETTATTEINEQTESSTNVNSETILTSQLQQTTSSIIQPDTDNPMTTTTTPTSFEKENVVTLTSTDASMPTTTVQQITYSDLENTFTSTAVNTDNAEINTQLTTTNEAVTTVTLPALPEVTAALPEQTINSLFVSTTEYSGSTTSQIQQSTNNNLELTTIPTTLTSTIYDTTTLSSLQLTGADTNTKDTYEETTTQFQQSTINVEPNTTQTTPEQVTSDIPTTSTVFVDSTEEDSTTQELVTQPSSSDAGTVDESFIENINNITIFVNNQTFVVTRPNGKATNFNVNVRIDTVTPVEDLTTTETIQSRNIRSVKSVHKEASNQGDDKHIHHSKENKSGLNEKTLLRNKDLIITFFDVSSLSTINTEHINLEKLSNYQEINFRTYNNDRKVKELEYSTIYPGSGKKFNDEHVDQNITISKDELHGNNDYIRINNTIYIKDQNNLNSNFDENLTKLTTKKIIKNNYRQIRKPRSINDYILARQYDQSHYFRPPKPYLPQEPPYFLVDGKKESNLDFMTYDTVLPFLHVQQLGALALAFPLDSDKYYLLLLLPTRNNGLGELICNIRTQNMFKYIINNLQLTHVKATIPSFNLKGRITLTNTLQKLGIRKIFQPRQADFTPMTDDENIYVTNIEQAVSVTIKNYMDFHKSHRYGSHHYYTDPVRFEVHRPFLYFVIDSEQQVLLMAGKVVNPLNIRIK